MKRRIFCFVCLFILIISTQVIAEEKPEIFPQMGHVAAIDSVAFSPDGKFALSGSHDKTLRLWDVATGKEIRSFAGHTDGVSSVAFSPDGRFALSGSWDKTLRLWDVATGKELRSFTGHTGSVRSVAFSPDGKFALSGSDDKTLRLWDAVAGKEIRTLAGHVEEVTSVAFSPDGRFALSGSVDRTMRLWVVATGKELRSFAGHAYGVYSIAFSPDGRLALSWTDRILRLWDVATGKEVRSFHVSDITSVALSPNGRFLLSGNHYKTLNLWDMATGKEIRSFAGHTDSVASVAFSADGKFILSGSYDRTMRLWDVATGKELRSFAGYTRLVCSVALSSDARFALSGSWDNTLRLWDVIAGKEVQRFVGHKGWITSVAFSPDGRFALSGSIDHTMRLWDVDTVKEIRSYTGHTALIYSVALSSDGRFALSGSADRTMRLWDVALEKEIRQFAGHTEGVRSVAFSPDGKFALSGSDDKTLRLRDVETGNEIRSFAGHTGSVRSIAFLPNGKYALSGSGDGTMRLWDVATGEEIRLFAGHADEVTSVAFSPDGRLALSGSDDKTLRLWDVALEKEIRSFIGHTHFILSVAFSSDRRFALSGGTDTTTRIWDINTGREIVQFIGFTDGEWIAITPEGYYNSSLYGHKYLNIRIGNKVYGIDQFYDVFYRPDIVATKLRGKDISGLITLTIDDAIKNPPPAVEFTTVPKNTDRPKAKVCYQAKNTGGGIGEIRLFHNGKLIQSDGFYKDMAKTLPDKTQLLARSSKTIYEDLRNIKITSKADISPTTSNAKGDVFLDCREIDAIPGENEVSVTAFNGNNTVQSYMQTVSFNSTAKSEDPHLYILSIGIDQYKDASVNLKYAVKDSRDIQGKLMIQAATIYAPQNIHHVILTNKDATKPNIEAKIKELSQQMKPTDRFIMFVAGHGVLLQNQYYMLTHDYDGNLNETTLVSSNEIVEMSKKIKSLSQLFIFDTCHAGGVDNIVSGLYDARMSVLAKKMGLHIYASASDKQAAMDGYKGNGLFSYTLLDGLNNNKLADKNKDGTVSVVGLGEYSKKITTDISKEIGHNQTPLIINFGKDHPLYKLQ